MIERCAQELGIIIIDEIKEHGLKIFITLPLKQSHLYITAVIQNAYLRRITLYIYHKIRLNPFMPTVPTFAVRETDVSRHNGGTSGAPIKPLRDDSALRALSSLRGLRGSPEVPPLC